MDKNCIQCDCSGLINLLCDELSIPKPYAMVKPRAVNYFGILQEIGSNHISQIIPGTLMAWRKENLPKSGDSGHALVVSSMPNQIEENIYRLTIIDATKARNGLSRREIELHTRKNGQLTGVQMNLTKKKVKRTQIYHAPLINKRYCFGCGVPKILCLCQNIEVTRMKTSIIILRHPDERKKTLSTVSLIKQRYPDVLVKEARIFHPMRKPSMALLFPIINSQANQQQYSPSQHKANDHNKLATRAQTLVLLDATWRKAKRILHENSWIADLPRISIKPKSPSGYLLRKVPNANALSTVEVFAHIQNDELLQDHFRWFIKKQIERIGIEKYRRNYRHHINYTPKKP